MSASLVGSEMCIRDSCQPRAAQRRGNPWNPHAAHGPEAHPTRGRGGAVVPSRHRCFHDLRLCRS
eukprot:2160466-Alexandrium_andersonii.AAC.1